MADLRHIYFSRSAVRVAMLIAVTIGLLYVLDSVSSDESGGFRLRAETMLPERSPVWPDDVRCPSDRADSPVEFSTASALAYELPAYESELLFSRITLAPYRGSIPEQVTFRAEWPTESIAADSPICAFVLADEVGSPTLTWQHDGEAAAEFVIDDPRPHGSTTVEVWLQALRPTSGVVFGTTLSTPAEGDNVIVEPLGGRIDIEPRRGTAVSAVLSSELERIDGREVQVRVELPNQAANSLALDTEFVVSAGPAVTWTVNESSDAADCTISVDVRCRVGDISGGDSVTMVLEAMLPADWEPSTDPNCRTAEGRLRIGLCVIADVSTLGADTPVRTSLHIAASSPVDSPITGVLVPDPLVVRRGELAAVTYVISSVGATDLGSVEVTGTDCLELARVPQALDDDDAFLEVGETWHFDCLLDAAASRTFRLDLAALSESAEPVSTSIEGVITVINPALDVAARNPNGAIEVTISNIGDDSLSDIAVVVPGCQQPPTTEDPTDVLPVGATIRFECTGDGSTLDGPIVYALDSGGQALAVRPDPRLPGDS